MIDDHAWAGGIYKNFLANEEKNYDNSPIDRKGMPGLRNQAAGHPQSLLHCRRDRACTANAKVGQPLVLLESLKDSQLAERFIGRAYLGQGLLCSAFEGLCIETVEPVAIKVLGHELAADKKTNARFVIERRCGKR